MTTATTPENQLCLLLLRRSDTPDVRKQISEIVAGPFQWPLLVKLAHKYGIAPLLYYNLESLGFPGVPEAVQSELGNFLSVNAIRNELLAAELARLLQLLGDAKIPAIPLKSTVLGETLYGDPALRVSADIDLLVPAGNVVDAHNLILSSGYDSQITPFFLDLLARYGKDCELMREDPMCTYPVELHCGLVWGGRLERDLLKDIWADAVPKSFYGVLAFALSNDWEFLYLAIHAARHGTNSLKWYVDLDRYCSRYSLDWASITAKAQRLGWEAPVREVLSDCARLLGTSSNFSTLTSASHRPLASLSDPSLEVPGGLFSSMRLLKRPTQKLRFLAIRIFVPTPADGRFLVLPSSLAFLYYVLRPFRFAAKSASLLIRSAVTKLRGIFSKQSGANSA